MIKREKARQILDKILSSSLFQNSEINKKLLEYLVNKYLDREVPKETAIAIDVFDKDSSYNPHEDTLVRVHIYKLRNKLEKYYLLEGKDDEYKLCIPKGHYEVKFIPQKRLSKSSNKARVQPILITLSVLIVILTGLVIGLLIKNERLDDEINSLKIVDAEDLIWKNYLQGRLPNLIVNGDNYFFSMDDTLMDQTLIVRNTRINSTLDLHAFLEDNPIWADKIYEGDYAFLGKESAWSLQKLFPIFYSFHLNPELTLASQLTWEDFQKYNILYLGSYKALGILNSLITNLSIQYQLYPHKIIINSDSTRVFTPELTRDENQLKSYNKDYALCVKLPGPNNNAALIIAGFYFIGVYEAVKQLTDPTLRPLLENYLIKQHGHVPEYFEVLMEISGFGRTGFSTTYIHSAEIKADYKIEWKQ
ncbi:hypothetical protein GF337_12260 [candidate division KSB1 bacterium]|nr:hypothetical protein [candidate division KSB1 bacterium]